MQLGILSRLAEELADRLRNVPGTDTVRLFGEPAEQITVVLDPAELAALGLSIADVATAISNADSKMPAGTLRTGQRDLLIEVDGELDSAQRIGSIPLANNATGAVIRLGDIARVVRSWQQPPPDLALSQGQRAVLVAARVEEDVRVDHWGENARAVVEAFGTATDSGIGVASGCG